MDPPVRWGILGNATIARVCVIPALCRSKNCQVVAMASTRPDEAAAVAARHSIPQVYDHYEAVLADAHVEAVYIPLPNHLHHPWTLKALAAGKHVLCEKPLACTARQAEEMAAAAHEADRLLMEAFMYRFHPRSRQIRQMVASGAIGTPRMVRAAFCYAMAQQILEEGTNPRLQPQMGGGALLDVGCYGVSVARWLLDEEPQQVQSQAFFHTNGVDVHLAGVLRFSDRKLAVVEASFISALQQTFMVNGSRGCIELPHNAFIPWDKDAEFTLREQAAETGEHCVIPGVDEYQLMVAHFSAAVRGRLSLAFTPRESIANMRVLDALARAARTGETARI